MRQKSSGWKKCVDETKRQNEFVDEFTERMLNHDQK